MPVQEMAVSPVKSLYWEQFPPMSQRRVYCTPVYHEGLLYVLGGCSETGMPLDSVEVLDVESQTWSQLPPLPTARAGASAVALGGQVMVLGGMNQQQTPLASVEMYHPDEGKWETKASLGQPSMGVTTVEKDGKVYAFGGMGADTTPQALVRVYEAEKDQWQSMTSMPTPRYGATPFMRGNKLYLMAGRQGKMPVTALEAFDLEMKSWTRYPCIPSRRAFSCCAMNDRSLFSLGGLQQPGPHNFYSRPHFVSTMEEYDLDQGNLDLVKAGRWWMVQNWVTLVPRLQRATGLETALTLLPLLLVRWLSGMPCYAKFITLDFFAEQVTLPPKGLCKSRKGFALCTWV
uniref:Kelch domain-containing protein 8B n=1 Tax=Monopterus albus TaxID=43700 RepID=A0A3Q3QZL4_MONAL